MFKIDWPCAIGGVILGYYTKGKVESAKTVIRKISTDARDSIKESFADYEKPQQATQGQTGNGKNG